ncbi:hypothetical protein niasHT_020979 [Heterodera trifolii]|uniref:guanylate cyclase n=1 Tax=Heterodera trifolii TaxID=157864 RepID=A0ABD2KCN9_9BILA
MMMLGRFLIKFQCQEEQQTMPDSVMAGFTTPSTPVANQMLIKVAMLVAQNDTDFGLARKNAALPNSGGAIPMALEQLWADEILPKSLNFSIHWTYSQCNEAKDFGQTYNYISKLGADAIIATTCIDVPPMLGHLAANFNIPMLVWGQSMSSNLASSNNATYPTLLNIVPNYKYMASGLISLLQYFNWTQIGIIIQSDIVSASGVVLLCFDDLKQMRTFALQLFDGGLNTKDYVYIMVDNDMYLSFNLTRLPFWVQSSNNSNTLDGRNADAEVIGRLALWWHYDITLSTLSNQNYYGFFKRVIDRTGDWPFYCDESNCSKVINGSLYSLLLYDAIYNYGMALNESFRQFGIRPEVYRNGTLLAQNNRKPFMGLTGYVTVETDQNTRVFVLSNRKSSEKGNSLRILMQFAWVEGKLQISLRNGSLSMWSSRGGSIPPAVPICGFDGKGCAASVFEMYKGYLLLGIALFVVTISGSTFTVGFLIHAKFVEGRRSNMSWKIPFALLTKSKPKRADRTAANRSRHSVRSNQTNISSLTHSTIGSLARSRIFSLYSYNGEKCIVRSFGSTTMAKALTMAQMAECRTMRLFDHENVNRFLGLSLDGPNVLAVWNFCMRGSIRDVILSENAMVKDVIFIQSAIKELCEGIHFLHNSPLQFHGRLKSSACLINDRWQVKISYFGLRWLKSSQKYRAKDLLWLSPEQLRKMGDSEIVEGSKPSDIYTMALIFTEVQIKIKQ